MKIKLVSLLIALTSALNINANTGSLNVDYASMHNTRNIVLDTESVTSGVSYTKDIYGVGLSFDYLLTKSLDGVSIDDSFGVGFNNLTLTDTIKYYVGLYNRNASDSDSLEFKLQTSLNTLLTPTLTVYREVDENVYTGEFGVSHSFSVPVDFTVSALVGATESAVDDEYINVGVRVPWKFSDNACAHLDGNLLHSSEYGESKWIGVGISVKF